MSRVHQQCSSQQPKIMGNSNDGQHIREDYGKQSTMFFRTSKITKNNNGTQHIRADYGKQPTMVLITHVKITEQLTMVFRKHANTVTSQRAEGFDSTRLDSIKLAMQSYEIQSPTRRA
jgi:hypothetical protein